MRFWPPLSCVRIPDAPPEAVRWKQQDSQGRTAARELLVRSARRRRSVEWRVVANIVSGVSAVGRGGGSGEISRKLRADAQGRCRGRNVG